MFTTFYFLACFLFCVLFRFFVPQQPLKPAQTNKTRSIPHPDPKKAKTGAENKTAEGGGGGGSKGGGKAKKAVPKKQASMMSFFKKA